MKKKKYIKFRIISYQQGWISSLRLPYFYAVSIPMARERASENGIQYFVDTRTEKIYSATTRWWLAATPKRKN